MISRALDEHNQVLQGQLAQAMGQVDVEGGDEVEVQQKSVAYERNQVVEIQCYSLMQGCTLAGWHMVLH